MDGFFSEYRASGFERNPEASLIKEFDRLAVSQHWKAKEKKEVRQGFKAAMVAEFNARYGTNDKDLRSWQNLCKVFNIQPVPTSITKCKEEIKKTHVNLVDLIQLPKDDEFGVPAKVFPTLSALRKYTKKTKKVFPKEEAKAGGILKHLLRVIR